MPTRKARRSRVASRRRVRFNGAASLPTRKDVAPQAAAAEILASMGPRRCRRGRAHDPSWTATRQRQLQWGRVVADAEGIRLRLTGGQPNRASMGPRRCRRGRGGSSGLPEPQGDASMGPRRCRRGRCRRTSRGPSSSGSFNGAASLPTRKGARTAPECRPFRPLQWGRVVADAEGGWRRTVPVPHTWLQWGRVVADAEGGAPSTSGPCHRTGLNGAASLPTRKVDGWRTLGTFSALQWGRVVADAEGSRVGVRRTQPIRFNGAASLPTRKGAPKT